MWIIWFTSNFFFWVICARTNQICLHKLKNIQSHTLTHAITPLIQNYTYLFCMFDWCLAHLNLVAAQDFRLSVCVCVCTFFCGQSMFNYIFIVAPVGQQPKRPNVCARQSVIQSASGASYS